MGKGKEYIGQHGNKYANEHYWASANFITEGSPKRSENKIH